MKFPRIFIALVVMLSFSCEKEEVVNEEAIQALVGHWHIWDFEPDASSPAEESQLAKEAILKLVEVGCDPIEFTFNENRGVRYSDGMRYLNATSTEDGVQVNCAPQYDDQSGTFNFDFEMLTLDFDSQKLSLRAALEDDRYFTTQVSDMLINGVEVSGKLYFIRETGH